MVETNPILQTDIILVSVLQLLNDGTKCKLISAQWILQSSNLRVVSNEGLLYGSKGNNWHRYMDAHLPALHLG